MFIDILRAHRPISSVFHKYSPQARRNCWQEWLKKCWADFDKILYRYFLVLSQVITTIVIALSNSMVGVCIEKVTISLLLQLLRPDKLTPQLPQYYIKSISALSSYIFLVDQVSSFSFLLTCLRIPLLPHTCYMFSHPLLHSLIILKCQWRGSGPSSPKPYFDPKLICVCVGFVVDILWMGQAVLRAHRIAPVSAFPTFLHTAVPSVRPRRWTSAVVSAVRQHASQPSP